MKPEETWIYICVFLVILILTTFVYMFCRQLIVVATGILIFLLFCFFTGGGMDKVLQMRETNNTNNVITAQSQQPETDDDEKKNLPAVATLSDIVAYAQKFVGNPYVWGGESLTNGCDCSHLVCNVLKDTGHYNGEWVSSTEWAEKGQPVEGGLAGAQDGDIIVYANNGECGHVAIYYGDGRIIEAQCESAGITNYRKADNGRQIIGVRRFPKL